MLFQIRKIAPNLLKLRRGKHGYHIFGDTLEQLKRRVQHVCVLTTKQEELIEPGFVEIAMDVTALNGANSEEIRLRLAKSHQSES
jgi:hypothetical protein